MLRLRDLRFQAGMTQSELAKKLGTTQRCVSNWENGNARPDLETIIAIADVFNETTDYVLGRDSDVTSIQNVARPSACERNIARIVSALSEDEKRALLSFLDTFVERVLTTVISFAGGFRDLPDYFLRFYAQTLA